MKRRIASLLFIFCLIPFLSACSKHQETTGSMETVFNKRFMPKIKHMMTYDEMVKIIGKPGTVTKDTNSATPQIVHYHWDGGRRSSLDARVEAGKLVDATMLAPNGNTYKIGDE